ncbi:MAG: aminopeptidase [Gammaproteobacteria bacterium]
MDAGLRRAALAAALAAPLSGCYYGHLLKGQVALLSAREPIDELIASPTTDAVLRARLERAQDARRFASRELKLPDNGSYTSYADLGRPYAVWNVFAAPELALEPHEWCYPLLGCLAYRGFYDVERAKREAAELGEEGLDTFVAGIGAYSTLGWFDDPLLNTMRGEDDALAGTIFHELAHQVVFADGDTAFNESFATFVEQEGLRRYLAADPALAQAAARRQQREDDFLGLMMSARTRLEAVYQGDGTADERRAGKREAFERLRQDYASLREQWGGDGRYDGWLAGELNNARMLPFGLYNRWVPAFAALFERELRDWRAFYRAAGELAELEEAERREQLARLNR